jgi:light-independent protochlorophyllide reductase subunit B
MGSGKKGYCLQFTIRGLSEFLDVQGQQACAGFWSIHTIDCQNLSRKKAFVFGDSTHTAAMIHFLNKDIGIQVVTAETFYKHDETWFRSQVEGIADTIFLTDKNTRLCTLIA